MKRAVLLVGYLLIGSFSVAGCIHILPPVFAQSPPAAPVRDGDTARLSDDDRQQVGSLLAIVAGVGLWGAFRLYQRRQRLRNPQQAADIRRAILTRLAALDEAHAQGRVRERAYQRKRARLKHRAVEATLRLRAVKD